MYAINIILELGIAHLAEKYGLEAGEIMAIINDWDEWVRENVTELIVVNWN